MLNQDAMQIKERIISLIRLKGPSLPVHVAKETGLSILFASAFLSELLYEKKINISNIRVGNSPLYFISGQEPQLERFSQYLKSREKDAFLLIKERKFLKDEEEEPAIRVALRGIKDFAIPFRRGEEIYWRYFTIPETDFQKEEKPKEEEKEPEKEKKIAEIFPEEEKQPQKKEKIKKKPRQENRQIKEKKKRDENFFNKIKESLSKEKIEILDIKDFTNDEAVLRIKKDGKEELFFVYNKKRITEKEILKAHKKASENKMKYSIFFLGEPSKKLMDLIFAVKDLSRIDKIK